MALVVENTTIKLGKGTIHPTAFESVTGGVHSMGNNYIRYHNGVMKQWGRYTVTTVIDAAYGTGMFYKGISGTPVTFPATFKAMPDVTYGLFSNFATGIGMHNVTASGIGTIYFYSGVKTSSMPFTVFWEATGRWK